jgi:hypothetical protein
VSPLFSTGNAYANALAACHLRVVQSSFAGVITDFIKSRYTDMPDLDLVAEVAGAALAAALVVAVEN